MVGYGGKGGRKERPMRPRKRPPTYLWSFGRLLRKMRGSIPLDELAARTGFDGEYLKSLEAGRLPADEFIARHVLSRGFRLGRDDVDRLILGIQLYDLG